MTYAEYLRSLGATEDEVKVMDTGIARRAFDKQQADLEAANTARDAAVRDRETNIKWVDEQIRPAYATMQNAVIKAQAEEARAKRALLSAQEQGLVDVAKDLGYDPAPPTTTPTKTADGFDAARYMTRDEIVKLAADEGNAIAVAQDIAAEHAILFPGQRLNFRDLLSEARRQNTTAEALWMTKYKVSEARATAEAKRVADHEAAIRKDEREKAQAEFASKYANPATSPLMPSTMSFTPRPNTPHDKQPWETSQSQRSNDRVMKVVPKIVGDAMRQAS